MAEMAMEPSKEVDLYRDTPVRFIGYTNEVGEAFRPLIHKNIVNASYLVASIYVFADVRDKINKMRTSLSASNLPAESIQHKVFNAGLDTLIWQTFASVCIPGLVINRFCAANYYLLKKGTRLPQQPRKFITTTLGLLCIPFIVHPIDDFTTFAMDSTIRKWWIHE